MKGLAGIGGVALVLVACAAQVTGDLRPPPSLPGILARGGASLPPGLPARLVVVSVAGLDSAAVLEAADERPVLAALAAGGALAEAVEPVAPASSYPAHTTFVTGLSPAGHGVAADRMLGRNGVRRALHSDASRVRGATLWQLAASEGVVVAALDWPATLGASIPMLVPDVVPTRRGETWKALLSGGVATPWLSDLIAARADPAIGAPGAARDALLVDLACRVATSPQPPLLLLLRLRQAEIAAERSGRHSPATRDALASIDRELGRLIGCLDTAGRFVDSALVVLGDRALLPVHTEVRVNEALAAAGLVDVKASTWDALARSNGGSAFVYAADESSALAARSALDREATRSGAFRIVGAQEMIRRGADPDAWFGLEAEPGYTFADTVGEPRLRPSAALAAGGQISGAGSPAFVAYGRGIRPGVRIPLLRQIDVAPTLAALLGRELPDAEGRTVVGLFEVPGVGAPGPGAPGSGSPEAAAPTAP